MILDKLRPYLPPPVLERGNVVRNERGILVGGSDNDIAWGIYKGKDPHSNRVDVMHQGEMTITVGGKDPAKVGQEVLIDEHGQIYGNPPTIGEVVTRVELLEEAMGEVALELDTLDGLPERVTALEEQPSGVSEVDFIKLTTTTIAMQTKMVEIHPMWDKE